jgi:hypothetical protein
VSAVRVSAGVYETYDGDVVAIVDAKSTQCMNQSHMTGKIVPTAEVPRPTSAAVDPGLH